MIREFPELGIRMVTRWIFNTYIIEDGGDGAPFIVDAGLPITGKDAYEVFTGTMGKRPEELALLTATHAHSDHVAGIPGIHDHTRAPVHLHEKVRDFIAGEKGASPSAGQMWWYRNLVREGRFEWQALKEFAATGGNGKEREGMGASGKFALSCPVHGFLEDGQQLPGAPDWTVLHTPGHTDCSICFWNEKTGTLLSGDTILTIQDKAWFNPVHAVGAKMGPTEERLRGLPVQNLLPGHGNPVFGRRVLQEALSHKERVRDATPNTCALKKLIKR